VKLGVLGASIAALVVSTGSLLAPQAASALDLTFSFDGVTGRIQNLDTGTWNPCDGTTACIVTIDEPAPVANGTYTWSFGRGFLVFVDPLGRFDPEKSSWDWFGTKEGVGGVATLFFYDRFSCGSGSAFGPGLCESLFAAALDVDLGGPAESLYGGPVTFAAVQPRQPPASSVPGPLPLFGAAAAFRFSRKLRNRIKVTRTTAPTRPAG